MSLRPLDVRSHDSAGFSGPDQHCQSGSNDPQLYLLRAGWPQWRSIRKPNKQRTRRLDALDDIATHDDTDGRDTLCLDGPGDQSHGLLAQRSTRCEKRGIYPLARQPTGHLRRSLGDELFGFRQIAHEAVRPRV